MTGIRSDNDSMIEDMRLSPDQKGRVKTAVHSPPLWHLSAKVRQASSENKAGGGGSSNSWDQAAAVAKKRLRPKKSVAESMRKNR